MYVATGTVTVNAAFLQEIKDDAREFRQSLALASEMLAPEHLAALEPRSLMEQLGRVRDQLALHFSLEEAYGYFEDAISAAPHLSEQAEVLRAQHQTLFADFGRIVAAAEELLYGDNDAGTRARVARLYQTFRADLQLHEAREQDLILAAFNDDLGGGD